MKPTARAGLHPSPPLDGPPIPWPARRLEEAAVDALAAQLQARGRADFMTRLEAGRAVKAALAAALRGVPRGLEREAVRDWNVVARQIVARRRRLARERAYSRVPRRRPR